MKTNYKNIYLRTKQMLTQPAIAWPEVLQEDFSELPFPDRHLDFGNCISAQSDSVQFVAGCGSGHGQSDIYDQRGMAYLPDYPGIPL